MGAIKALYCSKGHKLVASNLYMRANGQRECRLCSLRRATASQIARRTAPKLRGRKEKNA